MRIRGGALKNRRISAPKGGTRPTSEKLRQAIFDILQDDILGVRFLDLFAGSGAVGIEGLSRGAAHTTFVDNDPVALRAIRSNLAQCDLLSRATILNVDVFTGLKKLVEKRGERFEVIYVDPPYRREELVREVLRFFDSHATCLGGRLFIERGQAFTPPSLSHLFLEKERKVGGALLYQYRKLP